jgi:hypothetical protein
MANVRLGINKNGQISSLINTDTRQIAPQSPAGALVGSHRSFRTSEPPLPTSQQASPFFCIDVSKHGLVEHLFCQKLLQLAVLVFQSPQSLCVRQFHADIHQQFSRQISVP